MQSFIPRALLGLCVAAATLTPASADAAAYLKIKGQKQGQIKGSVTKKLYENALAVVHVTHEIVSPRDAASGLPTGKRTHKPLHVAVNVDKAMPLLYSAMTTNETLTEVVLPVTATDAYGKEVLAYTIKLTNASLASISLDTDGDAATPDRLNLAFTYQKIEWTWADGGIMAMDDWESMQGVGAPRKPR